MAAARLRSDQKQEVAGKIEKGEPVTAPGVPKHYPDAKKLVTGIASGRLSRKRRAFPKEEAGRGCRGNANRRLGKVRGRAAVAILKCKPIPLEPMPIVAQQSWPRLAHLNPFVLKNCFPNANIRI